MTIREHSRPKDEVVQHGRVVVSRRSASRQRPDLLGCDRLGLTVKGEDVAREKGESPSVAELLEAEVDRFVFPVNRLSS